MLKQLLSVFLTTFHFPSLDLGDNLGSHVVFCSKSDGRVCSSRQSYAFYVLVLFS